MAAHSAHFNLSREELYAILIDYAQYPRWTADVTEAVVLDRESDIVVAQFVSPELLEDKYVLESVHSRPESIVYHQVDQFDGRGLRGSWQLTDAAGDSGCILKGEMYLRTRSWQYFTNKRKAVLILQRRFDALQRLCAGLPFDQWAILSTPAAGH